MILASVFISRILVFVGYLADDRRFLAERTHPLQRRSLHQFNEVRFGCSVGISDLIALRVYLLSVIPFIQPHLEICRSKRYPYYLGV